MDDLCLSSADKKALLNTEKALRKSSQKLLKLVRKQMSAIGTATDPYKAYSGLRKDFLTRFAAEYWLLSCTPEFGRCRSEKEKEWVLNEMFGLNRNEEEDTDELAPKKQEMAMKRRRRSETDLGNMLSSQADTESELGFTFEIAIAFNVFKALTKA